MHGAHLATLAIAHATTPHMATAMPVPWQDTTTALGTAAAALVAAGGFVATIWITRSDRRRGDEQRHQDRLRDDELRRQAKDSNDTRAMVDRIEAARRIAEERQHAADEATRRFHVETLLKAVEAYGDMLANNYVGNLATIARGRAQTYLLALPPAAASGATKNLRRLWLSGTVALAGVILSGAADIIAAMRA